MKKGLLVIGICALIAGCDKDDANNVARGVVTGVAAGVASSATNHAINRWKNRGTNPRMKLWRR